MNPSELSPSELQFQVERLLTNYAACIDDDRLEEWPNFFTPKCLYKIISRENADRNLPIAAMYCDSLGMLQDRVIALRHANIYAAHFYRHLVSCVRVTSVESAAVRVQSNYLVLQTLTNGDTHIYNAGKYLDKIVFSDAGLLFEEKYAVFDTYRVANLMVTPI